MNFFIFKKYYFTVVKALALVLIFTGSGQSAEIFSLRNIKAGTKLPAIVGKSVLDHTPQSFSLDQGRPSIILFFTMRPPFRQKRSLDLIMQINELITEGYQGRVDFIPVFSDNEEVDTLKKFITDGLVPSSVVDDSDNNNYSNYGVFMTPIVVLSTVEGILHEVIPATFNIKKIVENNLKLLLGEWTKEDFHNSFKVGFTKVWTEEEKEYLRRINYGKIMYNRKMYTSAVREFSTAAKIQPGAPEGHIGSGMVYYDMKNYDKAEQSFNQALSIDSDSDEALAGLGLTLVKKNMIDKALPILENAIISEDPSLEVLVTLAEIYEEKGNVQKAMRLNKMAILKLQKTIQ